MSFTDVYMLRCQEIGRQTDATQTTAQIQEPHKHPHTFSSCMTWHLPPALCLPFTDIYVLKCQEIGETPSSKVMAQMKKPHANMAHCKLGR